MKRVLKWSGAQVLHANHKVTIKDACMWVVLLGQWAKVPSHVLPTLCLSLTYNKNFVAYHPWRQVRSGTRPNPNPFSIEFVIAWVHITIEISEISEHFLHTSVIPPIFCGPR